MVAGLIKIQTYNRFNKEKSKLARENCYIRDNPETSLCHHGVCNPVPGTENEYHKCICDSGYDGIYCDNFVVTLKNIVSTPFGQKFILPLLIIMVLCAISYTYHIIRYCIRYHTDWSFSRFIERYRSVEDCCSPRRFCLRLCCIGAESYRIQNGEQPRNQSILQNPEIYSQQQQLVLPITGNNVERNEYSQTTMSMGLQAEENDIRKDMAKYQVKSKTQIFDETRMNTIHNSRRPENHALSVNKSINSINRTGVTEVTGPPPRVTERGPYYALPPNRVKKYSKRIPKKSEVFVNNNEEMQALSTDRNRLNSLNSSNNRNNLIKQKNRVVYSSTSPDELRIQNTNSLANPRSRQHSNNYSNPKSPKPANPIQFNTNRSENLHQVVIDVMNKEKIRRKNNLEEPLNAENIGKEGQPINRISSVNSHLACDLLLDEEKRYKGGFG